MTPPPVRVLLAVASLLALASCELQRTPPLITVYSDALEASFPLYQGWSADTPVEQAGFFIQTFTGRSVDVPERPGIRVQVMRGPTPDGDVDLVAERFRRELNEVSEEPYELSGFEGKRWHFLSDDEEESSTLMLVDVDGRLYGIFVRGEAHTVDTYQDAVDRLFSDFALEQARFFPTYEAPSGDVVIPHPRSWERTGTTVNPGESLFVSFRSTPLAVEQDGTTVHATLEVTVNQVEPGETVESFYERRTEALGDTYRLIEHEVMEEQGAISTLYHVETQLADYLERTVYFVHDDKSFIYKFNCRNRVYRAIEGWLDEIVAALVEAERGAVLTDE